MAVSKSKYHVSVTKLQRLPPIREETMSRTPRSAKSSRSERLRPIEGKITVQPLQGKPTIHVRPLPGRTSKKVQFEPEGALSTRSDALSTKSDTEILDSYPKTVYKDKPKEPLQKLAPNSNPQNSIVDGLVADYLHYAKYGHIIPVYEGTGNLSCSCCTDRNRENVRTILGFPVNPSNNSAQYKPIGPNPKPDTWLTGNVLPTKYVQNSKPSPRFDDISNDYTPRDKHRDFQQNEPRERWLEYQPKPYASSYTNAEFNRPSLVYNHLRESDNSVRQNYSNEILNANTKYDDAMKKLAKFTFS